MGKELTTCINRTFMKLKHSLFILGTTLAHVSIESLYNRLSGIHTISPYISK